MGIFTHEEIEQLYAPFPLEAHKIREGGKAGNQIQWFVYLDRVAVQRRLDTLFPGEWEFVVISADVENEAEVATVYAGIVIRGLRRDSNGTGKPRRSAKSEDEGIDENTTKGALTDAFRRAASMWGLGLYLYDGPKLFTDTYDWKTHGQKSQRETQAKRDFAEWYHGQFGGQPVEQNAPQSRQQAQDAPQPQQQTQSSAPRGKNPYTRQQAQNSANQAGWELNDQSEGILIMRVKKALPNEAPPHVVNAVRKMRADGEFAGCATFADAVALAIAHFEPGKPDMNAAF